MPNGQQANVRIVPDASAAQPHLIIALSDASDINMTLTINAILQTVRLLTVFVRRQFTDMFSQRSTRAPATRAALPHAC